MENIQNINGVSYAGSPLPNTAMYITKKVEKLIDNLYSVDGCLVFAEDSIDVPEELKARHCFRLSPAPQREYAQFVTFMAEEKKRRNSRRKVTFTEGCYYIGENVTIGEGAVIEPGAYIGHDVVIGRNAHIKAGASVKDTVAGDNFIACENCTVGTTGFTMAEDEEGNKIRIATLGKVIIGNNVEVGSVSNVSCGSSGNTVIEDNVKIDSLVHIGHDAHLCKNVELPAGVIVGGFCVMEADSYAGINSTLRNRIRIGRKALIGMGAVVTKNVDDGVTVVGNPAKPFISK